jgi:hypothetical protein
MMIAAARLNWFCAEVITPDIQHARSPHCQRGAESLWVWLCMNGG